MRRYGRFVDHDPKSRGYGAVLAAKPKTVLWRHEAPVPIGVR